MSDYLRPFVIVALSALVVTGLSSLTRRAKPLREDHQSGLIRPERWTAALTVLGGCAMLAVGVLSLLAGNAGGVIGIVLGAAIAGFMAPSLTSIHAVRWNNDGIEGPSQTFGPTLGLARTKIKWSDIASTGKTMTGYWFVQAHDGRRIFWSYLYKGYGALTGALSKHCPALSLPPDMSPETNSPT